MTADGTAGPAEPSWSNSGPAVAVGWRRAEAFVGIADSDQPAAPPAQTPTEQDPAPPDVMSRPAHRRAREYQGHHETRRQNQSRPPGTEDLAQRGPHQRPYEAAGVGQSGHVGVADPPL